MPGDKLIDIQIRDEGFSVRCTRSYSERYIVGKVYHSSKIGNEYGVADEGGYVGSTGRDFKNWYKRCGWTSYDFEEV